jgi:ribonuclease P protein component
MDALPCLPQIASNICSVFSMKLQRKTKQKLFLKSKTIFKTAFFYVKLAPRLSPDIFVKHIIVISKKCGNAVVRNYIRRMIKIILKKNQIVSSVRSLIIIFEKIKLSNLSYAYFEHEINILKKNLNI